MSFGITFLLFLTFILKLSASPLNHFVNYYEELNYAVGPVAEAHSRARRDVWEELREPTPLEITFRAFGRLFPLVLELQAGGGRTFREDHVLTRDGKPLDVQLDFFYEGHIKDEPGSFIHGHVLNNTFGGILYSADGETYFVERRCRHFKQPKPFHSIIYREKDVSYPNRTDTMPGARQSDSRLKRSTSDSYCALSDVSISEQLKQQQRQEVRRKKRASDYSWAADTEFWSRDNREKRQVSTNNVCTLKVESDWLLWEYFQGTGLSDDESITNEIVATMHDMVTSTRLIYERTRFETYTGSISYTGLSFQIQRTEVLKTCSGNFCKRNLDVNVFLNEHSYRDFDQFCLALLFTYRDFAGGTLGLAWVGDPGSTAGGICERYKTFRESSGNVQKSLNTAIVTLLNHGKRVDIAISRLTTAHEIGHNFGSPHDDGPLCVPYNGNVGNYIMYASSTSGRLPNNQDFSPCSRDNMTRVIDAVKNQRNGKVDCFVASGAAFCGNALVESGEVCDCGYDGDAACNHDVCCVGRNAGNAVNPDCTLKQGNCSPSMGPCCNVTTCGFHSQADNITCKAQGECHEASVCDGLNYTCPTATPKSDTTLCSENTKHCKSGECTESICDLIGWEQCFPDFPNKNDNDFDLTQLCYLGCSPVNSTRDKCESTQSPQSPAFQNLLTNNGITAGILMPPGSPCDDYRGYCDVFNKCRSVDAEGPLTRLRKLLFSDESLRTVREWITKYWWAVMLMVLGLFAFMALFIKCCAVHTPSSNPNAPKARSFRETLRRPSQMVRRGNPRAPISPAAYEYRAGRDEVRSKPRH